MPSSRTVSSWLGIAFVASLLAMLLLPLPSLGGTLSGHAAGVVGTLFVLGTLIYPFRKRVLGRTGRNNPVTTHVVLGLVGSLFLVVHSGGRFPGLIVTLTFLVTVAVVLSGISGMFFFYRVRRTLGEYRQEATELKELFHEPRRMSPDTSCGGISAWRASPIVKRGKSWARSSTLRPSGAGSQAMPKVPPDAPLASLLLVRKAHSADARAGVSLGGGGRCRGVLAVPRHPWVGTSAHGAQAMITGSPRSVSTPARGSLTLSKVRKGNHELYAKAVPRWGGWKWADEEAGAPD